MNVVSVNFQKNKNKQTKRKYFYLSLDRVERPCRRMGTTVWSRYALVGNDCSSTLGFVGFSAASFSFSTIFYGQKITLLHLLGNSFSLPQNVVRSKVWVEMLEIKHKLND